MLYCDTGDKGVIGKYRQSQSVNAVRMFVKN